MLIPINSRSDADSLRERARAIRLLLMDCDGVMTDGRLYFNDSGECMKTFHVRDGQGIASWHAAGFRSGIITGRGSDGILRARSVELGIEYLRTRSADKVADLESILRETGVDPGEVAYIGDDIGDIGVMREVGFPVAVADAIGELDSVAICRTQCPGGAGAVREVVDFLLASNKLGDFKNLQSAA